jgi:hypothetical protein
MAIPGHHLERFTAAVQLARRHLRPIRQVDQRPRRNAFADLIAGLQQPLAHRQRPAARVEVQLLRVGAVVGELVAVDPPACLSE